VNKTNGHLLPVKKALILLLCQEKEEKKATPEKSNA
jgi:hypothetical protein